jgi:hypothetical protein
LLSLQLAPADAPPQVAAMHGQSGRELHDVGNQTHSWLIAMPPSGNGWPPTVDLQKLVHSGQTSKPH